MARSKGDETRKAYARRRAAALRGIRKRARTSAGLITKPQNVAYLTGFGGEDSWILLGEGFSCLITDGRFAEQAAEQCPGLDLHVRKGAITQAVGEAIRGRSVRSIAVEADHLTLAQRDALSSGLGRRGLVPLSDILRRLRECKDSRELRSIRKAVRTAQRAFCDLLAEGATGWVGKTERQLAARLDYLMRLHGAEGVAFETIVAAGTHASQPHYRPGNRRIRSDDAVLIDWGARVEGYVSDLTRVVSVGRIPPNVATIYDVVRRAQKAAISMIRPGVSCKSVDLAARRIIDKAGFGRYFVHGLGHGIGRECHEWPVLSYRSKQRLRRGMTLTVEPGIYLPGVGGVRIEDDVLVTSDGHRRLSSLPRRRLATTLT